MVSGLKSSIFANLLIQNKEGTSALGLSLQDLTPFMGMELGADDYVTIPFNPYDLRASNKKGEIACPAYQSLACPSPIIDEPSPLDLCVPGMEELLESQSAEKCGKPVGEEACVSLGRNIRH
jgi:hypothetical protein